MRTEAPNLNALWAALVIEELVRNGVDTFFLSPGSRCTPLTVAAAQHPRARKFVHFDERGQAYQALGYARATGRPAAVVCTSGTAVANLMPAVVEAAMSHTPLIVLSGDRPPELLQTGANQTIDQTNFFGKYVRWEVTLPCPDRAVAADVVLTTVDQAVYRARRAPSGPVHINCQYREPLEPCATNEDLEAYTTGLKAWKATDAPYTVYVRPLNALETHQENLLLSLLGSVSRGLIVVGELHHPAERDAVAALVRRLNWPTLPDVSSGLRLGVAGQPLIAYYDQLLLSPQAKTKFKPDAILHIGGAFVSKRLLQCIEGLPHRQYIHLASHPLRQDPVHRVSLRIEADIASTCAELAQKVHYTQASERCSALYSASERVAETVERILQRETTLSEPGVARLVSCRLPENSTLFLGNSMPIRDMDMYGAANGAPVRIAVNRGASGIDGNIATVAGHARAAQQPVTAIIGDLAALHDLNSLALLKTVEVPVVLVVLNNRGGGIFSFLPIAEYEAVFEPYFCTPHAFGFEHAAAQFGLAYAVPATPAQFADAYQAALDRTGATLIEVNTDRRENHQVHQAVQREILAALGD